MVLVAALDRELFHDDVEVQAEVVMAVGDVELEVPVRFLRHGHDPDGRSGNVAVGSMVSLLLLWLQLLL